MELTKANKLGLKGKKKYFSQRQINLKKSISDFFILCEFLVLNAKKDTFSNLPLVLSKIIISTGFQRKVTAKSG